MSLAENRTPELWRSFMPRRAEIGNPLTVDLLSVQVYDKASAPALLNPRTVFEKWAAVEVADFEWVPPGMDAYTLPGGLYAVFLHKGAAATAPATFRFIFETWLPAAPYVLDDRPHFEVLGVKYKNDDPTSEEEIWIPIRLKV